MPTNEFLPFADSATGDDILSQAAYSVDPQRPIGKQLGLARRALDNKALRQSTALTAALAQLTVDRAGVDMLDNANQTAQKAALAAGIDWNLEPVNHAEAAANTLDGTETWSFKKAGSWARAKLDNVATYIATIATVFVQSGAGAVLRTLLSKLREIEVSLYDFGYTDGMADALLPIQRAIASLPARGGVVRLPPGTINLSAGFAIGDGNGGSTPSTKNGIKLRGAGAGFAVSGGLVPTILNYTGAATTGALIDVKGQISDCELSGFFVACNGNIGGIKMTSFSGCKVERVKIVAPNTGATGLSIIGGTSPTGNYNVFNVFSQINIALTKPSSTGLYMDGNYAVQNDTWISRFDLVRIETVAGATNATCAWFKFVDSCTFHRCHIDASPEPTALGAVFDATSNNNFPAGMAFYDCSIDKYSVIEDGSHVIRKNYFYGFGTYDGETVPTHTNLVGITDTGVVFGDFLYNAAWSSYTPTVTAQSGSFTTVSATGRWKQTGKLVFVEIAVTITTNGTAAGDVRATLPSAPGNVVNGDYFGAGRNTATGGMLLAQFTAGGQTAFIKKYDDSYPGASGAVLKVSGVYEVA